MRKESCVGCFKFGFFLISLKASILNWFLTTVAHGLLGKTFLLVSKLFRNVFATCLVVSVGLDRPLRDVAY